MSMSIELPKALYGSVSAGEWPRMDAEAYAQIVADSGCNSGGLIEMQAPAYGGPGRESKTVAEVVAVNARWIRALQAQLDALTGGAQ